MNKQIEYHLIRHYRLKDYWVWQKDTPHPAWADATFAPPIFGINKILKDQKQQIKAIILAEKNIERVLELIDKL